MVIWIASPSRSKRTMNAFGAAFDIVQFIAIIVLSVANGAIAYLVYRVQRDRNTSRLVMYVNEVREEEGRVYQGLYVQNVGLVPALNVRITVDIEEWRGGNPVRSRFHQRYDEFSDHLIALTPQAYRSYELPWMEGWSLLIAAVTSCSNGSGNNMYFAVGNDRTAQQQVLFNKKRGNRALKAVKMKATGSKRGRGPHSVIYAMGLDSLKDYEELFGRDASDHQNSN